MISRREFLQATAAASAITFASGLGPLGRAAAQQRLTQADILRFEAPGAVTILHIADLHAQLVPLYFREPSVNLGPGEAKGKLPHLTDAEFRAAFKIAAGTAQAHALTSEDFASLARSYGKMGGVDRIAALISAIRAERGGDNVLLLDGGDTLQGSWTCLKSEAHDMVEVLSALNIEATTGHWEFTLGARRLKQIAETAPFAFLAQNVRDKEWQEAVFPARKMFERGGVKIAVIGQAFPRTAIANPRWLFPDWEFGLREEDLQKQVNGARAEGAGIVVLLSHNGFDVDRKLASRVQGIDVILTSHTHDAMPGALIEGKTLLIASGSHGKFLSRLDLDVSGGKMSGFRFKLMPVFSDAIKPDAAMTAMIGKIRAPHLAELTRELGRTETLLYRRGNFNGTLDDLFCQAMLAERDAEIALSPGIRWGGSLLPGDAITFEAVTNASALSYPSCYRSQMTGGQLKDVLEDVADNIFHPDPYFQGGGDMVRCGGLGYSIDVSKPIGGRISGLTLLKSGAPLEASKSYAVAGWASVNESTQGPPIWEVVSAYLARVKTVKIEPNTAVKLTGV